GWRINATLQMSRTVLTCKYDFSGLNDQWCQVDVRSPNTIFKASNSTRWFVELNNWLDIRPSVNKNYHYNEHLPRSHVLASPNRCNFQILRAKLDNLDVRITNISGLGGVCRY